MKNKDELLDVIKNVRNNERKIRRIEQEAGATADDIMDWGTADNHGAEEDIQWPRKS